LTKLLIFIACMRIIQVTLNTLTLVYLDDVFNLFVGEDEMSLFTKIFMIVGFVGDLILVSVLPFLYSLGQSFIKIFLTNLKSGSLISSER
jgi:hypothetical protein